MRATRSQSLGYDFRVGFQDYGQVGAVSFGIQVPEEGRVDTVEALHDKARRNVAVTYDSLSAFHMRADFSLHMMITVRRIQAGQGVAGNRFGQLTAQNTDWPG